MRLEAEIKRLRGVHVRETGDDDGMHRHLLFAFPGNRLTHEAAQEVSTKDDGSGCNVASPGGLLAPVR